MKKSYLKKNNQQGFSLVEFIVVLVIFSAMAGTSLFNFNEYRNNIEQTNIAQDIALTIRQAQVYGLSASGGLVGAAELEGNSRQNSSDFFGTNEATLAGNEVVDITQDRSVRGVAIITDAGNGSQELIIFEDLDGNPGYNAQNDRVIDVRTILSRGTRMSVCLIDNPSPSPVDQCEVGGNNPLVVRDNPTPVSIMFQRPYPDSYLEHDGIENYNHIYIELYDSVYSRASRYIEINSIGNISVRNYE